MSEKEFKPIESQDALDSIIQERLKRNTESVTASVSAEISKKYEGYISPDDYKKFTDEHESLKTKLQESEKSIADLTAKNSAYEVSAMKMKIAQENGIPIELAERLTGGTEDEIKADAVKLAALVKPTHQRQSASKEGAEEMDGVEKRFRERNPNLKF